MLVGAAVWATVSPGKAGPHSERVVAQPMVSLDQEPHCPPCQAAKLASKQQVDPTDPNPTGFVDE